MININLKKFNIDYFMDKIKDKMPFYNERHFQMELAIAIKDFYKGTGIDVLVESFYPITLTKQNTANQNVEKRNYTDIVIYDEYGNYISVELKYALNVKDRNKSTRRPYTLLNGDVITIAKKGALDNIRYDYLFDIYRLEQLKKSKTSLYEYNRLKSFYKGYAVILSNGCLMWEIKHDDKPKVSYNNFCLGDKTQTQKDCSWTSGHYRDDQNKGIDVNRPDFKLNDSYSCNWNQGTYFEDTNNPKISPDFRYLAIEVK